MAPLFSNAVYAFGESFDSLGENGDGNRLSGNDLMSLVDFGLLLLDIANTIEHHARMKYYSQQY